MNTFLHRFRVFVADPLRRRSLYLVVLFMIGLLDYALTSRTARSFEFPSISGSSSVVERRFLPRTFSREEAIRRYVSEYLLGPAALDSSRLFDKDAALRSILVRDGTVHVDLTAEAAFPAETGADLRASLAMLASGIERNFPGIRRAAVYIDGHEPFVVSVSRTAPDRSASKTGKSVDK